MDDVVNGGRILEGLRDLRILTTLGDCDSVCPALHALRDGSLGMKGINELGEC